MSNLARPNFISRDPVAIEAANKALWEAGLGKTLYPGQLETLLLNLQTYTEAIVRLAIQDAAEQNLVNYARGVNLDQLGALVGATRLPASAATTTIRFTKTSPALGLSVVVPSGTRVGTEDGLFFETNANLTIAPSVSTGDVLATCTTAGSSANGYGVGTVVRLLDPVANILSASNTTITSDGADIESDDRYRERIKLAPAQFSVAGSLDAYKYFTLTASQTIIDAGVLDKVADSTIPRGTVRVFPLVSSGIPSAGILSAVEAILNQETVRPLTDIVIVAAPTEINYSITATVTALNSANLEQLQIALNAAANAFASDRRLGLGRDVMRSQVIAALSIPGVYNVTLSAPSSDLVVLRNQWANCNSITVTISGTNEG